MKVVPTEAVIIARRTLGEDDQRRVASWIRHLENWENDELIRARARPVPSEHGLFLMPISSELVLFFNVEPERIVLQDITRKDTLERFEQAAQAHQ